MPRCPFVQLILQSNGQKAPNQARLKMRGLRGFMSCEPRIYARRIKAAKNAEVGILRLSHKGSAL